VADTIGTKSGMADRLVVVLVARDRIVSLSGYPVEQGNPDVTCPQQGNQNVHRGNALGGAFEATSYRALL
jgi:hypothetical protein